MARAHFCLYVLLCMSHHHYHVFPVLEHSSFSCSLSLVYLFHNIIPVLFSFIERNVVLARYLKYKICKAGCGQVQNYIFLKIFVIFRYAIDLIYVCFRMFSVFYGCPDKNIFLYPISLKPNNPSYFHVLDSRNDVYRWKFVTSSISEEQHTAFFCAFLIFIWVNIFATI